MLDLFLKGNGNLECFDTCVIALCFKRECRMNMYDM